MLKNGFTLVELLIVIIIIAILSIIGIVGYYSFIEKGRENTAVNALRVLHTSIEMYSTDTKGIYPRANSLNELKEVIKKYLPGGEMPKNPYNNMPYSDENNNYYRISYTYDPVENSYTLIVMNRYNYKRLLLLSNRIVIMGE
ncbi:MAG: prepilin-type N-terminal cleavage/methylation domain-containing protein [Dictyoglomaceae bacterium]